MTYTLEMRDDGGSSETVEIEAATPEQAAEQAPAECEDWCSNGEWGDDGSAIDVRWTLYDEDGDELDEGCHTVEIEPDHEALIHAACYDGYRVAGCGTSPDDHDWTGEGEGGCDENPGVWGHGGTAISVSTHCRRCGLHRTEHHTGSQRNPGEHDTVEYEMLDEEVIEQHRNNGTMDAVVDEDA